MDRAPVEAFGRFTAPEIMIGTSRLGDAASARLLQSRRRVFGLISNFQQALARPDGLGEAAYLLRVLLVSMAGYFGELDESLQDENYANATARRRAQKRILVEIKELADRSSESGEKVLQDELAHAADAFLMQETSLRARAYHEQHDLESRTYAHLY
jgi:hypothetical protein